MSSRNKQRGQTAVLFTLAILPLFGVLGLVVDVGWSYYRREAAQTAADAAASAAAEAAYTAAGGGAPTCSTSGVSCYTSEYTCPANTTTATDNIQTGCLYAQENGFSTTGKMKVTIQSGVGSAPTSSGATVAYWVSVRVVEQVPQLFSAVLGFPSATVSARTTTGTRVASSGGCVIALNPTDPGTISMNGTTNLTTGCGVFDNSNDPTNALTIVGSGNITTTGSAKTDIVGGWGGSGTISPLPRTHQPVMGDPFADMAAPSYSGCANTGVNLGSHDSLALAGSTTTTTVICGDINLNSQSTLTLGAGLYVVTGTISMGGQTSMSGSGVTLYLPNGGVSMAGGASVDLSAPSSGTWQGILFYQRRGNTTASTLVGGTGQQMNGVLYFPSSTLTYTGGSSTVATATTLVCDKLILKGNSYINASATTSFTGNTGGVSLIE